MNTDSQEHTHTPAPEPDRNRWVRLITFERSIKAGASSAMAALAAQYAVDDLSDSHSAFRAIHRRSHK